MSSEWPETTVESTAALAIIGRMNRITTVILFVALAAACGKDKGNAGASSKGASMEEKFNTARSSVKSGAPWGETTARLEKELGAPKSKTDTNWTWAVVDGDTCYDLSLAKKSDKDEVSGAGGGTVASAVEGPFERCKKAAAGTP